ncbi:MAG: Gldg family protein [Crinalium sp.]
MSNMKTIAKNRQYLEYLFLLGPILCIMGLVAQYVSGTSSLIPLTLLIIGIGIIVLWLLTGSAARKFWGSRSTQVGTNALVATLAVLGILGLINFLAVRNAVRWDLTENQLFTLSPQSQQVAKSLQQPVKVWVFDSNQNPANRELLENYRRSSSQFSFDFVDPELKPGVAQQFGVKSAGEVYIESGKKRQLVQNLQPGDSLSEAKVTNGITQILSDRQAKIYFLQGHGERPLDPVQGGISEAISRLQDQNFTAEPLNLAQKSVIPPDAAAVVVAGAKRALFPGEVNALKNYLSGGGSLLVMVDPKTDPKLDSLLQEWGVKLDNRLAVDASGKGRLVGLGAATPVVTQYSQHPITKDFGNDISFYPLSRPIEITPVKGIEQTPLLITDNQSWAESNSEGEQLEFNADSDRTGPLTLGVALTKTNPTPSAKPNQNTASSRLVVLGNSEFMTNGLFEQQLNGDVFLNSVSWLSKQDQQVLSIRPKEAKNRRINLTPQLGQLLTWMALLMIPLIGFTTAGIMWWRRR